LAAACATPANYVKPWPAREPADASAPTGALFKLNVDADMSGMPVVAVRMYLPTYEQAVAKVPVDQWETLTLPGTALNRFPNDVILAPLPPGNYYGSSIQVDFMGNQVHTVNAPPGGVFAHFKVPPGKVAVLGSIDLAVKNSVLSEDASGKQISTNINARPDSSYAKRLEVVNAALARPEADSLRWRAALEAARGDVEAAWDFADEYIVQSWPSRASPPVAAAHPPTGVLLKLSIDDSRNAISINRVKVYFRRADQASGDSAANFQYVVIPGGALNRFPNDLLLAPLSPGSYEGTLLVFEYGGHTASFRLKGDYDKYEVRPGKVTVLGAVDTHFSAHATTLADGRPGATAVLDVGSAGYLEKPRVAEARRQAVAAALARPEAESLNWREALEAAQAELAR